MARTALGNLRLRTEFNIPLNSAKGKVIIRPGLKLAFSDRDGGAFGPARVAAAQRKRFSNGLTSLMSVASFPFRCRDGMLRSVRIGMRMPTTSTTSLNVAPIDRENVRAIRCRIIRIGHPFPFGSVAKERLGFPLIFRSASAAAMAASTSTRSVVPEKLALVGIASATWTKRS